MKNSLSILCFLFTSMATFAQKKQVYTRLEFEKEVSPIGSVLMKNESIKSFDNEHGDGALELKRFQNEFKEFAKSKNVDLKAFDKYSVYGLITVAKSSGEIEYIITNKYSQNLEEPKKDSIINGLLTEFATKFKFKSLSFKSFWLSPSISTGKESANRKGSKNYISTIELAEKCDKPDTVTRLYFNQLNLETIPNVVYRFKNLEEIDLSKNQLTSIPAELTKIPKLKRLQLNFNELTDTSIHFSRNKHIDAINLQSNRITRIPTEIKKNRRLNSLWIGNNNLEKIDNQSFRGLKKLQAINLYSANMKQLPTGVRKLKNLVELDLYHNKLQKLPDEVCKLKKLQTLAVSHNDIGELPSKLGNLKHLKTLYTHHNRLFDLPQMPDLKLLDIKDNAFNRFPKNVYALNNLQDFDCSNNDLSEVPIGLSKIKTLKTCYLKTGNDFRNKQQEFEVFIEELEKNKVEVK